MLTEKALDSAKRAFFLKSGAGLGLPAAGLVYWLALPAAGTTLSLPRWGIAACFASRLISRRKLAAGRSIGRTSAPLSDARFER